MDERYRFLMDAGRMADATVELEGLRPAMYGSYGSMQATVRSLAIIDGDGRRVSTVAALAGHQLRWNASGWVDADMLGRTRPPYMEVRAPGSPSWETLVGATEPLGREVYENRTLALALVSRELGVTATTFDEVAEAARSQAAAFARDSPLVAVSWARKEPTVLYDPAWFEDHEARGRANEQAKAAAFREVASTIASLADRSRGETFYLREGRSIYMVGPFDEWLSESCADLRDTRILDDNGRLVVEHMDNELTVRQEVRIGEECEASSWRDDAAAKLAWGKSREPRAADFLGVPQPNLEGLRYAAAEARGRDAGVKEIRAGDRVVSAFCADQRDLVASDGQDVVEYNACDDDVLEGGRREFMRRSDDTDMDGIADGGEIDADHDGVPDIWESDEPVTPNEDNGCLEL